ncbi:MAG: hypothetical protein ACXADB_02460 [Candidatus Hermodarchaeia archaeon]|jgi:hypothetical protein
MKTYRKFLFILWIFIVGCAAGGWDITQPLITLVPEPVDEPVDRVHWLDYNSEEVIALPHTLNGECVLFYFKHELSCGECDALDEGFRDKRVVSLLNQHFISYKATDSMPDFESGMNKLGVNHTPYILIMKFDMVKQNRIQILSHHEGAIGTNGLIGIITSTLDHCN